LSDGRRRLELVEADSPRCGIGEQFPERRVSKGNAGKSGVEAGPEFITNEGAGDAIVRCRLVRCNPFPVDSVNKRQKCFFVTSKMIS